MEKELDKLRNQKRDFFKDFSHQKQLSASGSSQDKERSAENQSD